MRKLLIVILLSASASALHAQSLSPVIQQCNQKCSGQFSLRNNGVLPLYVTLELKSLSLDSAGVATDRELDVGTVLVLDSMSARIPPMADHRFSYKLVCKTYPCAIQIFTSMVVGKTKSGLQVRVMIPETVYSCSEGKADKCRETFRELAGIPKGK